jgi:biopolymer transport protein ExbD
MSRKKRSIPQVNSSSSADIAFMLLIFFLITTSMDTDRGLARRLPPPVPKEQKDVDVDIKKRNLLIVLINSNNQILCGDQYVDIKQLKDLVKDFVQNPYNDEHKPEKVEEDIPFFGKQMVTKNHIISLMNDRGTDYQAYIDVQNELARAYNELRNEVSKEKFGKVFDALTQEQQDAVIQIYPQKISEAEPKNYGGKK